MVRMEVVPTLKRAASIYGVLLAAKLAKVFDDAINFDGGSPIAGPGNTMNACSSAYVVAATASISLISLWRYET